MPQQVTAHQVGKWITHACERLDRAIEFIGTRAVACQAGGNLGIWPYLLATEYGFQRVVTFEPDLENFECLSANIAELVPQVTAYQAALGSLGEQVIGWLRDPKGRPGWHKVAIGGSESVHTVGTLTIDGTVDELALDHISLIALDVEGFEFEALKGAERILERDHPVVIIEDLSKSRFKSFRRLGGIAYGHPPGALQEWLDGHGYHEVEALKNDSIWVAD